MKRFLRYAPVLLGVLALLTGCGQRPHRGEEFLPREEAAQRAVEAALASWQSGERGLQVPGSAPAVLLADTQHGEGRKLLSFSVLGPAPGDSPRCFAVRLRLAGPEEEVRTRYVVLGIDPLWVIRHDDFEMVTHWDHGNMTP